MDVGLLGVAEFLMARFVRQFDQAINIWAVHEQAADLGVAVHIGTVGLVGFGDRDRAVG